MPRFHHKLIARKTMRTVAAGLAMLAALGAAAQTQQPNNTNNNQVHRPVTNNLQQHPQQVNPQAQATRWQRFTNMFHGGSGNNAAQGQQNGAAANQGGNRWANLFHHGNENNNAPAQGNQTMRGGQGLAGSNALGQRNNSLGTRSLGQGMPGTAGGASDGGHPPMRIASMGPSPNSHAVNSQMFVGHPAPLGTREEQNASGNIVRRAPGGEIMDVRSPKNNMSIQHGLDGSRRVTVEQPDGSKVFATNRGTPFVQHPYLYQARPFDHRTYYNPGGKLTHQFYRPYTFAGQTLDAYAPQRFYSPEVYQWVNSRYSTPQIPSWNYVTTPTPWFNYYHSYFTPEPYYTSPVFWLTDFVLATSLIAAYDTHHPSGTAAASGSPSGTAPAPAAPAAATPGAPEAAAPAVTPEVKEMVADELTRQVKQESIEAKANAQNKELKPESGGVVQELSDSQPHVFVVGSDLDLVDPNGRRCMISAGDVVQSVSPANPDTSTASAVVLASKGGECERAARVEISVNDLQEMQNHMRETIDQGMAATSTGKSAPTAPAPYAQAAGPDTNAAHEIEQQQAIAAAADG
jgi:hypothetical protein